MLESEGIRTLIVPQMWWVAYDNAVGTPDNDLQERVQKLVDIISLEKPALVHTNTSVIWEGALAARLTNVPHVWHQHEILDDNPRLKSILPAPLFYHLTESLSDRVVAVSNVLREKLARYIRTDKLITIHNGVDAKWFEERTGGSVRNGLGLSDDDLVVTTIASLGVEKGHETLIDAAGMAVRNVLPLKFVIVGDGPSNYRAMLEQKVKGLGIADRVIFTGYRDDIPAILDAVDFVVIPSLSESFSLVAIEAMAAGKAVISTACGGPDEIIVHGKTGYLVSVNDSKSMAERIVELAGDSEKRRCMGEQGRKRFCQEFRTETYVARFAALYQDVLESRRVCGDSVQEPMLVEAYMETYQLVQRCRWQEQIIHGLLNSASWQITAPLRSLHSWLTRSRVNP